MVNDIPKRQCFVGLFDILGFSSIVKNNKLENIWKAYNEIKSSASFIKNNLELLLEHKIINVDNFSDTFLIYTADYSNKKQEDIDEYFNGLLGMCDALFHSANTNGLPIRGAITVGELIVNKGIHIGKPIIEAYEMEQKQDWIGCWISDDAINLISKKLLQRHMEGKLILKYKIPLKIKYTILFRIQFKSMNHYVFNWVTLPYKSDYDYGVLRAKPEYNWSVKRKQRNTRDYIKFVTSSLQNRNSVTH